MLQTSYRIINKHHTYLTHPFFSLHSFYMLPEHTFLFDTIGEDPDFDTTERIPFAPTLHTHIHPRDHFQIHIPPCTTYTAQFVTRRDTCRVPRWQQSSGLPLGDQCGLFRVYTNHAQMNKNTNVDEHLLRVPLQNLSKCTWMKQVHITNAYTWLPLTAIIDVAFIAHAENVQNSYSQFGGKGIDNSFYTYSRVEYSMSSSAEISISSSSIHHSHFLPFAFSNSSSHSHVFHSFNSRIFHSLGVLRDATNKLMHTKRMFQRNVCRLNHYMSAECWGYLCLRLAGKCAIVDGEVERVRRLFLSDLAQEKRKFHRQHITTITI